MLDAILQFGLLDDAAQIVAIAGRDLAVARAAVLPEVDSAAGATLDHSSG